MRSLLKVLFLVGLLIAPQTAAFAWNDTSHMLIAEIANRNLNPAAKQRINELCSLIRFKNQTYDNVTIAVWMDDLRDDPQRDELKPWHFIDLPFFEGVPARSTPIYEPNLLTQTSLIIESLKRLAHSEGIVGTLEEARSLGYLYHLVGDAHQPLHCVTRFTPNRRRGDVGGNLVRLLQNTRYRSLHSYWDSAADQFLYIHQPRAKTGREAIADTASKIMADYPATAMKEIRVLNVKDWVEESRQIAMRVTYMGIKDETLLSNEYIEKAREETRRRIAISGYRLAEILNQTYPADSPRRQKSVLPTKQSRTP